MSVEAEVSRAIGLALVKDRGILLKDLPEAMCDDRAIVLRAVKQNSFALQYASARLKSNKAVVSAAFRRNPSSLKFASITLRNDIEFVLNLMEEELGTIFSSEIFHVEGEFIQRKLFLKAFVSFVGYLQFAADYHRRDKEIVKLAVQHNGMNLKYASKNLQNDKEVVLFAVRNCGEALQFASEELKGEKNIVLLAVQRCGKALQFASEELKGEKDLVFAGLKQDREALIFASNSLLNDKEFIIDACLLGFESTYCGWVIDILPQTLKEDLDVVMTAVSVNERNVKYASTFVLEHRKCFQLSKSSDNVPSHLHKDVEMVSVLLQSAWDDLVEGHPLRQKIDDAELFQSAVISNGLVLKYASENLRNNREIVMFAVRQNGNALEFASDNLRDDMDIVTSAVENTADALEHASDRLKSVRILVMMAVRKDGNALRFAANCLQDDRDITLTALKQTESALTWICSELRQDKQFILHCLQLKINILFGVSTEIQNDEIVLQAVCNCGTSLRWASDNFKKHRNIVMAAVQQDGLALEYVAEEMKDDVTVVSVAVQQNGLALRYASKMLKRDMNIILLAINQNPQACMYAHWKLEVWNTKPFSDALERALPPVPHEKLIATRAKALELAQSNGIHLQSMCPEFQGDREIVSLAVKQNGLALQYAADVLKEDPAIVLLAVRSHGLALNFVSCKLQRNKEIVKAAISSHFLAFKFASEELTNDISFLKEAVILDGYVLHCFPKTFQDSTELVLKAVQNQGSALQFASERLKGNRDIVLAAVIQEGCSLLYAKENLKQNKEIVRAAFCQNSHAFSHASDLLKRDAAFVEDIMTISLDVLEHASDHLTGDKSFMSAAISKNWMAFRFSAEKLRSDQEFACFAISHNSLAILDVSQTLQTDIEFLRLAAERNRDILQHVPKRILNRLKTALPSELHSSKLCSFFQKGKCKFGNRCKKIHSADTQSQDLSMSRQTASSSEARLHNIELLERNIEFEAKPEIAISTKIADLTGKGCLEFLTGGQELDVNSFKSIAALHSDESNTATPGPVQQAPQSFQQADCFIPTRSDFQIIQGDGPCNICYSGDGPETVAVRLQELPIEEKSGAVKKVHAGIDLLAIDPNASFVEGMDLSVKDGLKCNVEFSNQPKIMDEVESKDLEAEIEAVAARNILELKQLLLQKNLLSVLTVLNSLGVICIDDLHFLEDVDIDSQDTLPLIQKRKLKNLISSLKSSRSSMESLLPQGPSYSSNKAAVMDAEPAAGVPVSIQGSDFSIEKIQVTGYQIISKLGQGGQAKVYLATKEGCLQRVALKIWNSNVNAAVLQREVNNLKLICHSNIPQFYELIELPGPVCGLVMEYIEGISLRTFMGIQGRLEWKGDDVKLSASKIIYGLLCALHELHSFRPCILHRDVKPENIMLSSKQRVVLVDFGLAKRQECGQTLTATGIVCGTVAYMSPESIQGGNFLDARADVWSAGLVLYEMLCGSLPFKMANQYSLMQEICDFKFENLPQHNSRVNSFLDQMLKVDLECRLRDATECTAILQDILRFGNRSNHEIEGDFFSCVQMMWIDLPPVLRSMFLKHWYVHEGTQWKDTPEFGCLYVEQDKSRARWPKWVKNVILSGDTSQWDMTVFCHVLLWSSVHPLPEGSIDREQLILFHQWRNELAHWRPDSLLQFKECKRVIECFLERHWSGSRPMGKRSNNLDSSTKVTLSLLVEAEMQMQSLFCKGQSKSDQSEINDIEDEKIAKLSTEKTKLIQRISMQPLTS